MLNLINTGKLFCVVINFLRVVLRGCDFKGKSRLILAVGFRPIWNVNEL